jgi:hypothetical protein
MFIIWSGWGALTILILGGVSIAVGGLLQLIFAALGVPQLAFLAFSAGLFAAAAANWLLGKRLNGKPGRELLDPKTGERVLLRKRHSLFWLRMEYWSIPVAITGFVPLLAIPSVLGH